MILSADYERCRDVARAFDRFLLEVQQQLPSQRVSGEINPIGHWYFTQKINQKQAKFEINYSDRRFLADFNESLIQPSQECCKSSSGTFMGPFSVRENFNHVFL